MTNGGEKSRARRRTAKEHGPDPVDIHVGQRLRLSRELAGLTQTGIGRSLAMSFQVVQKYEQGEIRISASRLVELSRLLAKPIDYFFAGIGPSPDAVAAESAECVGRREIELVRAFRAIASPELRCQLVSLLRDIAENPPG